METKSNNNSILYAANSVRLHASWNIFNRVTMQDSSKRNSYRLMQACTHIQPTKKGNNNRTMENTGLKGNMHAHRWQKNSKIIQLRRRIISKLIQYFLHKKRTFLSRTHTHGEREKKREREGRGLTIYSNKFHGRKPWSVFFLPTEMWMNSVYKIQQSCLTQWEYRVYHIRIDIFSCIHFSVFFSELKFIHSFYFSHW